MAIKHFIAGRSVEAALAAQRLNMTPDQYRFVHDLEDLRGLRRGDTVWLAGSYWAHPLYDELAEHCVAHEIGLVKV